MSQQQHPFLSFGFRPFYLLGAAWAMVAVPMWALSYHGIGTWRLDWVWHVHEMLFGFAPAVVAGFLLTAARNWTGRETASGGGLAALALLWLLGRVAIGAGLPGSGWVAASFLPALAAVVARPIFSSRNQRNYLIPLIILVWSAAQAALLLAVATVIDGRFLALSVDVALAALALLIALIGGRVIPAFTANAVAAAKPQRWRVVEFTAFGGIVLLPVAQAGLFAPELVAPIAAVTALAHVVRLLGFVPWHARKDVLLLALPLGYAWLPIHFGLLALDRAGAATHALTVGAVGGMMLAMMTRSALGHTGRALAAGPAEIACFALIHASALARLHEGLLGFSAALFAAAFAVFLIRYAPMLWRGRVT